MHWPEGENGEGILHELVDEGVGVVDLSEASELIVVLERGLQRLLVLDSLKGVSSQHEVVIGGVLEPLLFD